jgi:1-acyl-sn-glycerol-3-phosphate acyltransferase
VTDPRASRPLGPIDRIARFADGRSAVAVVTIWAAAEAIAFPIVPDVLVGLLVLAAPRRAVILFGAVLAGAIAGSLVLYAFASAAPDPATAMVLGVLGVRPAMLDEAVVRLAAGEPWQMAGFGPGTPLKVDTLAWALNGQGPLGLVVGVVVNRVTRVLPVILVSALVGAIAPRQLRRWAWPVIVVYTGLWIAVYAAYLR